jgi:hypothetical protein
MIRKKSLSECIFITRFSRCSSSFYPSSDFGHCARRIKEGLKTGGLLCVRYLDRLTRGDQRALPVFYFYRFDGHG